MFLDDYRAEYLKGKMTKNGQFIIKSIERVEDAGGNNIIKLTLQEIYDCAVFEVLLPESSEIDVCSTEDENGNPVRKIIKKDSESIDN